MARRVVGGGTVAVTLPRGDYLVGDPGYVVGQQTDWLAWLRRAGSGREQRVLAAPLGEHLIAACFTAQGDGMFCDESGAFDFPVDAGLLGVASAGLLPHGEPHPWGVYLVRFPGAFEVSRSRSGVVRLGHVVIDTRC